MDLSLSSSVLRLLGFYAVLLAAVFPTLHLIDRVLSRLSRARRAA